MLLPIQKKTAQAIVNLFETSAVLGDYSKITLIPGDPGHLTYGRSQTTLASGNLHGLIAQYCANPAARFAAALTPWIARLQARDLTLDHERHLHNLLRAAADDPIQRETQDLFFDAVYWQRAEQAANPLGIRTPLGVAVVYDSIVHGSWKSVRDRCNQQHGTLAALGERSWIAAYVATRRHWLATHTIAALHPTVYRMDAFGRLIDQGFWGLELPLVVRSQEISADSLAARPPNCYDGPQPGTRVLALQSPLLRGLDVRLLQLGLSAAGLDIRADGIYGQSSVIAIRSFQQANGLTVTGVADIALIQRLTL